MEAIRSPGTSKHTSSTRHINPKQDHQKFTLLKEEFIDINYHFVSFRLPLCFVFLFHFLPVTGL